MTIKNKISIIIPFVLFIIIVFKTLNDYLFFNKLLYILIFYLIVYCLIDFFTSEDNNYRKFRLAVVEITILGGLIAQAYRTSMYTLLIEQYFLPLIFFYFLYINYDKYGLSFLNESLKPIVYLINFFSITNLSQVFFNQSFESIIGIVSNSHFYNISYRTQSIFGHPLVAALAFSILFLLNFNFFKGIFLVLLNTILLVNIYSTQSRSTWLALTVVFILFFVKFFPNVKKRVINLPSKKMNSFEVLSLLVVSIFIFCCIFILLSNLSNIAIYISDRFGDSLRITNSQDLSNIQRLKTLELVLYKVQHSTLSSIIFGNGMAAIGIYLKINTVYLTNFFTADNQYLSILYNFGVVGIFFMGIMFVKIILVYVSSKSKVFIIASSSCLLIFINQFFFDILGWSSLLILLSYTYMYIYISIDERLK